MKRSPVVVAAAIVVLPAVFTVFPEWAKWPIGIRLFLVGIWSYLVIEASRYNAQKASQLDVVVGPALQDRRSKKTIATTHLVRELLQGKDFPGHYKFRLYIWDATLNALVPQYAPQGSDAEQWREGEGITGEAFRRRDYVTGRGTELTQAYRMTPPRSHRYAHLAVAAAMPVTDDRDRILGVLTGSSTNDDGFLVSPQGYDLHAELTLMVARVLLDIHELRAS